MTKQEYAEYELAVASFMAQEGIDYLVTGHLVCPNCGVDFDDGGFCLECGGDRECFDEPFFSWRPCNCCGTTLGGDRQYATSYKDGVRDYIICSDCAYYAEYGQLDDTTMENLT